MKELYMIKQEFTDNKWYIGFARSIACVADRYHKDADQNRQRQNGQKPGWILSKLLEKMRLLVLYIVQAVIPAEQKIFQGFIRFNWSR
jgi:hypothetical protein